MDKIYTSVIYGLHLLESFSFIKLMLLCNAIDVLYVSNELLNVYSVTAVGLRAGAADLLMKFVVLM